MYPFARQNIKQFSTTVISMKNIFDNVKFLICLASFTVKFGKLIRFCRFFFILYFYAKNDSLLDENFFRIASSADKVTLILNFFGC